MSTPKRDSMSSCTDGEGVSVKLVNAAQKLVTFTISSSDVSLMDYSDGLGYKFPLTSKNKTNLVDKRIEN